MTRDYATITADTFWVKTIVPYTEDPEIRLYTVDSSDLSALVADIEDPVHGEKLVDIKAAPDHDGSVDATDYSTEPEGSE